MTIKPVITLLLSMLLLSACATNVPESISKAQAPELTLAQVRTSPDSFKGQKVRWGGEIASTKPQPEATLVEVVQRDLGSYGRPKESDGTSGRFMARVPGFLDPAVYKEGRQFTVTGMVSGTMKQTIGEHPYTYPVVDVEVHHLWEPLPQPSRYDYYPWYYDPWYDPWGYPYYWHRRPYYWW